MSKTSAIADMRGLIGPFFDEDHDRALEIKKTILGKVKSFLFTSKPTTGRKFFISLGTRY